jgi:3-hydroxyisobutyrate dehydrogenase-like beta-hydroxyacid dehydrogenase
LSRTIGFIGLGAMGLPVAQRLALAGHRLVVHDQAADRVAAASATPGIEGALDLAEVTARADLLFTCLASPAVGEAVLGALDKPGLLVCDLSTIGPTLARSLHVRLGARGIGYVECPMLGGVDEAISGQLFLIVSGTPGDIARVADLFPLYSRASRQVGGPGSASLFKTLQNGLGLVQLCAIAETLAVLRRAGGDPAAFIEVVNEGRGMAATPLFRAKAPTMLEPDPAVKGSLHIGAKDSALAATLAREVELDAGLLERSAALFAQAMATGLAAEDIATVMRMVEAGP